MKYQLNKLPVKTTNGFKINDVEVNLEVPTFQMNQDLEIKGDTSLLKIQQRLVSKEYSSKIGLVFDSYYETSIIVPKGITIQTPIFIQYNFQKKDAFYEKIIIHYEEKSSCDFIVTYSSQDDTSSFHHLLETVQSDKNSCGNITYINLMNSHSYQMIGIENQVEEQASITHSIIDLGGSTRLYNVFSDVVGYQAKNYLNTIYLGAQEELIDFNYYLKNIGEESVNSMRVEGALTGNSHKNFRGTIDFIKGCSKSIGEENENCVLLSDTCRSRSLPQMLCGEEDVVGTHGVSSGKVSSEKLFYIMSRGYNEKEAEKLIVLANFMNILKNIPDEDVRNTFATQIE